MRYWLLTANPTKQMGISIKSDTDIDWYLSQISTWENWSVSSRKIKAGDGFFLIILGQGDMNGIVAKGEFTTWPYTDRSWTGSGTDCLFAGIRFTEKGYIKQKTLKEKMPDQLWSPQSSGISIRSKYTKKLEQMF